MLLDYLALGSYQTNSYIFGDEKSKEVVIIDAGENIESLISYIKQKDYKVKKILITHGHFDHTDGVVKLKAFTGAKAYMSRLDMNLLKNPACIDGFLNEGDLIEIGDAKLKVIHTPGHSQGGLCFFYDKFLFSGDTLFVQTIGRTDLTGGNYKQLIKAIKEKLLILPDDVIVYPGHGPTTTIGKERIANPYLS